jgi:hypothetical protein
MQIVYLSSFWEPVWPITAFGNPLMTEITAFAENSKKFKEFS